MIIIKNLRREQPSEPYDIRVDGKSIFSNPFYLSSEDKRNKVCNKYQEYFRHIVLDLEKDKNFATELNRLKEIYKKYGKLNLFCWCAPKRCHAETIKQYLEREENENSIRPNNV